LLVGDVNNGNLGRTTLEGPRVARPMPSAPRKIVERAKTPRSSVRHVVHYSDIFFPGSEKLKEFLTEFI
jgi:hypothetical protein